MIDQDRLTVEDVVAVLCDTRKELGTEYDTIYEQTRQSITANFEAMGGCEQCGGRGWVVSWDTLDSLAGAYTEYTGCPNPECTLLTRAATGLDGRRHYRDSNKGVPDPVTRHPVYELILKPLKGRIDEITQRLEVLARGPEKGSQVIFKADGAEGYVFWRKNGRIGAKILDLDGREIVRWANLRQVVTLFLDQEQSQMVQTSDPNW